MLYYFALGTLGGKIGDMSFAEKLKFVREKLLISQENRRQLFNNQSFREGTYLTQFGDEAWFSKCLRKEQYKI